MPDTNPDTQPMEGVGEESSPAPTAQQEAVPYARFKQVNDELRALRAQLAQLTGEREQHQQAAQTLEARLAALENERNQERAARQRLEIATAKGLPLVLADRLHGDTPEALEQDAERLLAVLQSANRPGVPPPTYSSRPAALDLNAMSPEQIRQARKDGKIKFV